MRRLFATAAALVALAGSGVAHADGLSWAPGSVVATAPSNGLYVWADGSYQHIDLPRYNLGFNDVNRFNLGYVDQVDSLNPNQTGGGFRGGLGYFVPSGNLPAALGMNQRIELGASYVRADGTQSTAGNPTLGYVGLQSLTGAENDDAYTCFTGSGFVCTTTERLTTHYASWQLDAKLASDYPLGPVTLTPSVALFGGATSADQNSAQTFLQASGGTAVDTGLYNAKTSLGWTDFGIRFGLDGHIDVTSWLAVGAGGYVGGLDRMATLKGHDQGSSVGSAGGIYNVSSSLDTGSDTSALVANAEVGLIFKPFPAVAIRLFGGVNFDSHVPGIASPTYAGSVNSPTSTTAASVIFRGEMSYYFGLGALWRF